MSLCSKSIKLWFQWTLLLQTSVAWMFRTPAYLILHRHHSDLYKKKCLYNNYFWASKMVLFEAYSYKSSDILRRPQKFGQSSIFIWHYLVASNHKLKMCYFCGLQQDVFKRKFIEFVVNSWTLLEFMSLCDIWHFSPQYLTCWLTL